MSTSQSPGGEPTEEELRAAYEAQLSQLRVEHIILDNVVMLINLGMRRTGLQPGTESERDPGQVRLAIEAVRALLPQVEAIAPNEAGQIRNALSQLQMAYVRIGGQPGPGGEVPVQAAGPGGGAPPPGGQRRGPGGSGSPGRSGAPGGPGGPAGPERSGRSRRGSRGRRPGAAQRAPLDPGAIASSTAPRAGP